MPPAQASTSRAVVVLSLSREERASLEGLRRLSELFAFCSFAFAFGRALAFPPHTASELGAWRACG
jgi:hypothetical protein